MSKITSLLAAASTSLGKRLIGISREMEESQRRFEVMGIDAETTQLLMNVCNKHRRSFDLDKRLARVAASGIARPGEIAAMYDSGPGVFTDFLSTYAEAKLTRGIPWPDLINRLDSGS